jgi:hypothetical protein
MGAAAVTRRPREAEASASPPPAKGPGMAYRRAGAFRKEELLEVNEK